jgi:hypothetical protein
MSDKQVVIHVRFAPNGTVTEIGERPLNLTPQQWFDRLSQRAANSYRAFAGGRGVFRLDRGEVDKLKEAAPN